MIYLLKIIKSAFRIFDSESSLLHKPTPEDKEKGYLYPVDNEVVDDLRRISRAYVKNIGVLPIISILPRR